VAKVRGIGKGPFAALEVDAQQLEFLLESGLITTIEENLPVQPQLAESGPIVNAPLAVGNGAGGRGQVICRVCVDQVTRALVGSQR
jgi:hypothetical protein